MLFKISAFKASIHLRSIFSVSAICLAALTVVAQPEWHSSSTSSGDGTSAMITAPSGLAAGHLMVVGLMLEKGAGVTVTAPSGWTLIRSSNAVHNGGNSGTDFGMRTYWKIAVAGDVGASFNFVLSTSGKFTISNSRFTGFDPDAPIQTHNGMGSANNSSGVTTAPTVTTTVNNTLVLAYFGIKKNVTVSSLGSGLTQRHFLASNDVANLLATFVQATAGETGDKTATFSQSEWRAGQLIAITPAPVSCVPPEITGATNLSGINNDPGECSTSVTLDGSNVTVTGDPVIMLSYAIGMTGISSPHEFPVGTTTVTVTATNDCGSDEATFDVVVADNEAPELTGSLPGSDIGNVCKADAPGAPAEAVIEAAYSDNCGSVIVTFSGTTMSGNDCDGWSVTHTYTVEDQYGNAAADAEVTYTGADAEAPTLVGVIPGGDVGNVCKEDAPAAPDVSAIAALYTDNCSEVVVTLADTDMDGDDCGWSVTYTYSVEDECGNPASDAVVMYTGADSEAPVVITMDITVYLDSNGNGSIDDDAVDNGSNDNCSDELTFSLSQTTFDCSDLDGVEVVLTVTDECGLSNTGTANVTVILSPAVWQSSATAVGKGGTHPKVVKPSGTVENDLLIVGLMIEKGTATTITPPSGWTLIRRTNQTTNVGMATYYKVATGSEPSSYTFNVTNSPKWAIGISRITGADTDNPVVIHNGASGGQVKNAVAPSITTTVCNSLVMAFYTNKKNATFTPAAGTTERYDVPNNKEGLPSNMLATYVMETAGPTGTKTAVASEKEYWVAQQVAIRPAGGEPMMALNRPAVILNPVAGNPTTGEIQNEGLADFSIYPNPSEGEVFIDFGDYESSPMTITVVDIFGKPVYHQPYQSVSKISLDLSGILPGMYLIRMDAADQSIVKKLMINR